MGVSQIVSHDTYARDKHEIEEKLQPGSVAVLQMILESLHCRFFISVSSLAWAGHRLYRQFACRRRNAFLTAEIQVNPLHSTS